MGTNSKDENVLLKELDKKWSDSDIEKAIELARTLTDGKHEFEVDNILGSSDGTYGIEIKYTTQQIIKSLNIKK